MKISFAEPKDIDKEWLAVPLASGGSLGPVAEALDARAGNAISRAIQVTGFDGASGKALKIVAPGGTGLDTVVVYGIGDPSELTTLQLERVGGAICSEALGSKATQLHVAVDGTLCGDIEAPVVAADIAHGIHLRAYDFDKYRTKDKKKAAKLGKVTVHVERSSSARKAYAPKAAVGEAVYFARDLVSEPANELYPRSYAERISKELSPLGVTVEILGEKAMAKLGMGALLGVGQGSARESQLVVMEWNGSKGKSRPKKPLAFIGKGVTFDTGGISIKPSAGMEDMKWDMGGSAAVVGLMHALAGRKAKVNAIGVVGLVENMPSGTAQRPGDVVKSLSGQTIEVLNTDAEGRLVLADALWYTQEKYKPRFMIDLATLTGAIMVALGKENAGLFCNDDALCDQILQAADATGERCWRLPLDEAYDRLIDGDISDVKNISAGRWGGSITAAQFLQRFTNGVPWAHLDIAGVAWADKPTGVGPKGATSFGVRLLNEFVAAHFE